MPSKTVRIAGKKRFISGLANDQYFRKLGNDTESAFVRVCDEFVATNAVCLDLGANIGVTALALSEIAPDGTIYAFEPSPTVYPLLVSNVKDNDCRNIRTRQLAVADIDGKATFFDKSAYGHISADGEVEVATATLETIVGALQLDRIDFIKIDIEGYEYKVLRSALTLLRRFDPIIYFEFNTWCLLANARSDPVEFLEWIFANFSFVAKVNPYSAATSLTRKQPQDARWFLHQNILAESCVSNLLICGRPPATVGADRPNVRRVGPLMRLLALRRLVSS